MSLPKVELDTLVLDPSHPDRTIQVGSDLPNNIRPNLIKFLKSKSHCFAWSHRDMTGISEEVITHKLNVDPTFKPVQQKRR